MLKFMLNGLLKNLKRNKIMTPKHEKILVEIVAWVSTIILITSFILLITNT